MYTLNLKGPVVCSIASFVLLRGLLAVALAKLGLPSPSLLTSRQT